MVRMTINDHRATAIGQRYLNDFKKYDPENGERIFNLIFSYENVATPESIVDTLERTLTLLKIGADYSECKTVEDIIVKNVIAGHLHKSGMSINNIESLLSRLVKED